MGVEYFRLTNFPGVTSVSEIPQPAWWLLGIGLAFLVFWTLKR